MRSGAVLVAGAINTDLVARVKRAPESGETVTGSAFDVFGGGKGANQALASARSGAPTAMLGGLGTDDFGLQRLADLRADGIDTESVAIVEGVASGVALITVEESGQNRIAYVPGATAHVTIDGAVASAQRTAPAVILSTLELPHEALRRLFAAGRTLGARIVLNATPEPADGLALVPSADVLVVNESEAAELLGGSGDGDWAAAARRLRALGPSMVVVTLGAGGALAVIGDREVRVAAAEIAAIDSTGAGDAFCGAFAARLADGASDEGAIRAGVAAGSLACTVAGAQRSMPRRAEIDAMLERMRRET